MKNKPSNRLIGWFFLVCGAFCITAGMLADMRGIQLGGRKSGGAVSSFQVEGAGVVMVILGVVALRGSKKK